MSNIVEYNNAAISIIESVNLQQVQATMQKIAQFQALVQKTLKKDHDFGVIPGTGSKPTLLKPGAEKILMLMGLTSEYEVVEKVQDYDTGFFAFTVKCTILRQGLKITEGVGHANTREKRYTSGRQQDPYTLANTVLKMAKKRAQIDAVLTVASLSEIFTQDLEDMDFEQEKPRQEQPRPATQNGPATEAQLKKLYAMAKEMGVSDQAMKELLQQRYQVESSKQLTKQQASDLIEYLEQFRATQEQPA
ncbi:hypothetical protein TcarDRAFT_1274 [Thermosinus carboxydivorans Nor1]|uniref:ERF family protein n=1 Tax=Thermosinus carboxydivorans Nor1 TaxID=401526 RepID=A1HR36_9FIRM|nr:phage protein GemA/Gp16 family protein [Thermosinus carboxydivorans]EAX47539.1 hypothetical protein TcarDRAFT_1274 [Thermosinus carboxydivorans Nor1]